MGSVEQGYTAIPVVKDTLDSHLSPSLAPSWKSCPLLRTKSCRTTPTLIVKSYIAAGQAGMALQTMAILQAYQADVLKKMDEGGGLTPEAVKDLCKATDLALRATKHTARAVGRSMAGSVAAECHLWLNWMFFSLTAHLSNWTIWGGSQLCGGEFSVRQVSVSCPQAVYA